MRSPLWKYLRDAEGREVWTIQLGRLAYRVYRVRRGAWVAEWRRPGGEWARLRKRGGKYGNNGDRVWHSEPSARDAIESEALRLEPELLARFERVEAMKRRLVGVKETEGR